MVLCRDPPGLLHAGRDRRHGSRDRHQQPGLPSTKSTTTMFSLSVTHEAPAADSVCTVRLTVNAAFTGVDTVNVPAGWTASVVGQVITWTAQPGNCLKAAVNDVTRSLPVAGHGPGRRRHLQPCLADDRRRGLRQRQHAASMSRSSRPAARLPPT